MRQRNFVLVVLVDGVDALVKVQVFVVRALRDAAPHRHILCKTVLRFEAVELEGGKVAAEPLLYGGAVGVERLRKQVGIAEEDVVVEVVVVVAGRVEAGSGDLGIQIALLRGR